MREEAERQRQRKQAERAAAAGGWKRAGHQQERGEHRGRVNLAATGFDLGDRVCNLACTEAPVGLSSFLFFSLLFSSFLFPSLLSSSLLFFSVPFFSYYCTSYLTSHTTTT